MNILLAKPRGFCAGVEMAVESVERALELFGAPLYVFHEIVHNTHVVNRFRERGVIFVDDLHEVPEGSHLLFSAHGVAPNVREEARRRRLKTVDATCPLVGKVHREAVDYASRGFTVLLIGHAGHDEVVGTVGEAPGKIKLVQSPDDVDQLDVPDTSRVAYLTQTTLSVDDANQMIEKLRQRFPDIVGPPNDDICYATQNRQEAVKALLPESDIVLVVGSQSSSNSNRLAEIARESGRPAFLVDGPGDVSLDRFDGTETVLITAGASAPEEAVQQCVRLLVDRFGACVDERFTRNESAVFPLPLPLRSPRLSRPEPGRS